MKPRNECTLEEISQWRRGQFTVLLPCLKCQKSFVSKGAHERLCKPCKATNKNTANTYLDAAVMANIGW